MCGSKQILMHNDMFYIFVVVFLEILVNFDLTKNYILSISNLISQLLLKHLLLYLFQIEHCKTKT
jgi:hypothetical protein